MEKRTLYIVVAVVLALAIIFVFNNTVSDFTGQVGSVYRTCIDSDNTASIPNKSDPSRFVKGELTYTVYDREIKYFDYCYDEKAGGYRRLAEFYCNVNEQIMTKRYICYNLCVDGACVKGEEPVCTDSDEGKNYEVKGQACVDDECKNDLCLDKIYLSEAYCEEGVASSDIYKCENSCENDVCV